MKDYIIRSDGTLVHLPPADPSMTAAGFEALENGWPFTSLRSGLVRYTGKDPAIIEMMVDQEHALDE